MNPQFKPQLNATTYLDNEVIAGGQVLNSEQIILALERILSCRRFAKSSRLSLFLRFVVEYALQGKAGQLKEYTIATKVYGRRHDFDPAVDTIVRSEARRLRRKLKEYYDTEGKGDDVVIAFRPGSYIPVHQLRSVLPEGEAPSRSELLVAVEPFECDRGNALAYECAFGISDEILHSLAHFGGIRVIGGRALPFLQHSSKAEEEGQCPPASLVIRGTVRLYDNILRVTARATLADRRLLWSHRVDSTVGATALIALQEKMARDVLTHVGHWLSGHRRLELAQRTCRSLASDPNDA